MSFLAPTWLLALVPWAGLALWLLLGRRQRVDVPFLDLWRTSEPGRPVRQAIRLPPPATLCALAALAMMIVAAARPLWSIPGRAGAQLTVLVDRGYSMSARGRQDLRYREAAARLRQALAEIGWAPRIGLVSVPPHPTADDADRLSAVDSLPPTAMDTGAAVSQAVAAHRSSQAGPLVVITDRDLDMAGAGVVRVVPDSAVANVGIVSLSARIAPEPQVMLRVRNDSSQSRATVQLISDGQIIATRPLDLPSTASQADFFIDVPAPGRMLVAELQVEDDLLADNRACLVRQGAWPRVEVRSPLAPELQRFVERYRQLRPASEASKRVAIVNSLEALPMGEPAAVLAAAPGEPAASGPITLSQHPLTAGLDDWRPPPLIVAPAPADPSWGAVARCGEQVILAARAQPIRQVWVGIHSEPLAATPEFVILWTNILNWVGEGAEQYASQEVAELGTLWSAVEPSSLPAGMSPGLWPGIYQRTDGALVAVNAEAAPFPPPGGGDWKRELSLLADAQPQRTRGYPLAGACLILSLALLLVTALLWRTSGSSLPAASAPSVPAGRE